MEAVLEETMILKSRGWLQPQDLALQELAEEPAASIDSAEGLEESRHLRSDQRVALELTRAHGVVTRSRLAAACGISGELARRELHALARLGLLRRTGHGRGTRYGPP
jgi:predicted HTH transcriptional regulator